MKQEPDNSICEALGLHNVVGLTLDFHVGKIGTVTVQYMIMHEEANKLAEIIKHYKLVPKEEYGES
jgi:hypothetical protein